MNVAGFGFRSTATPGDLHAALAAVGQQPDALATLRHKGETAVFRDFAAHLNLPVILVDEPEIAGTDTPTQSLRIMARFGTGSVAEAVALVAAHRHGPARLICPRHMTTDGTATVALAETSPQ